MALINRHGTEEVSFLNGIQMSSYFFKKFKRRHAAVDVVVHVARSLSRLMVCPKDTGLTK